MPVYISNIIQDFAKNVRKILGNSLDSVIVYGSYVRGDYSELSDIDVMLLVSLGEEEIKKISDQISDLAFDFMMKYGVDISPVITNIDHFNYWVDMQKCVLIMDFIEIVLIVLIMRCFMEYVLFLRWKVLISNVIKTL